MFAICSGTAGEGAIGATSSPTSIRLALSGQRVNVGRKRRPAEGPGQLR